MCVGLKRLTRRLFERCAGACGKYDQMTFTQFLRSQGVARRDKPLQMGLPADSGDGSDVVRVGLDARGIAP